MASCIICFTIYSTEDIIVLLNCQHCYHERCIKNWIKVRTECPQCRKKIQYNKSSKLFLNFTGQLDDESEPKPNLMLCRAIKAYTKKIKELEMLLTDKKLEIMNLHRLLQESSEKIDDFKRSHMKYAEENTILQQKIDEIILQNVIYFTDFYEFRSKYDQIVQEVMDEIIDVKKQILSHDTNAILRKVDKLLHMIQLVQTKEANKREIIGQNLGLLE